MPTALNAIEHHEYFSIKSQHDFQEEARHESFLVSPPARAGRSASRRATLRAYAEDKMPPPTRAALSWCLRHALVRHADYLRLIFPSIDSYQGLFLSIALAAPPESSSTDALFCLREYASSPSPLLHASHDCVRWRHLIQHFMKRASPPLFARAEI